MNGSTSVNTAQSKDAARDLGPSTHAKGGMAFGHAPHQAKQRKTVRFESLPGPNGNATEIIVAKHTQPRPIMFRMLPGGRWVELTVWERIMSGKRLPCDPWR